MARKRAMPNATRLYLIEMGLVQAGCEVVRVESEFITWVVIRQGIVYLLSFHPNHKFPMGAARKDFWERFSGTGGVVSNLAEAKEKVGLV